MPASPTATPERIKDANLRYHDAAAAGYDSKWGIDFGPIGQEQVRAKVQKALGGWPEGRFGEALEIGSGTGYFSLNLLQLGLIGRLVATDISPGMLGELAATAERLGLKVQTEATDAERLPFEDESFDLVFGHAVLHHLPDLPVRWPSSGGCCGQAARWRSAASPRATGTCWQRSRSTARGSSRRFGGSCSGLPRVARTRPSAGTGISSSRRWTCTPSPRERSTRGCARRGSRR